MHSAITFLYLLALGTLRKLEEESCHHKSEMKRVLNKEKQYRRNEVTEEMTDIITHMRGERGRKLAFLGKNYGRTECNYTFSFL